MNFTSYENLRKYCAEQLVGKKKGKLRIVVVLSTCSMRAGADTVLYTVQETIRKENISNTIVEITGCMGMCSEEPIVLVYDPDENRYFYNFVNTEKARLITISHGLFHRAITSWLR